ncbi:MAG: DUF4160 domain-containing protein [Rhodospirillales bacterium]|nr:DUF4160 domain-containing protein [Alphaproteobacteria bacterium]MCB9980842.1 DUF4160 domain-containing protein [Rhodospirillales bacterium]
MPTLLKWKGFRFFFYSKENGEPPYVHVEKGEGEGQVKFWLDNLNVARCKNMADHEVTEIRKVIAKHKDEFLKVWHEHFGS